MTKRVIVTGLGGFIGRHCMVPLLARGFEIHGLGRSARPGWLAPQIHWRATDLLDAREAGAAVAAIAPSHYLNLAWYTAHGLYWRSPINAQWVGAGLALMDAFATAGGKRFVGAGSCAEYDWRYGYLSEATTPLVPRTPFGQCKAALAQASGALAASRDLSFAWGRIFFVYGPHEAPERLIASVIAALSEGRPVKTTHGRQMRDFSHVEDIAAGFAALLDSDVTGAVNLGSGTPTPVRDLVAQTAALIGRPDLVEYGALPLATDEPPLLAADVARLRDEVGFTPRYTLPDGLRATVEAFQLRRT